MKTRIIVAAVLAISIFTACKKQENQSLKNKEVNYSTLDNTQIILAIKDFKTTADNKNANTEDLNKVISVENAIWLAEAAVNYDFDYGNTMHDQRTYSTQLNWNIDPNTISKTDASILYKQVKSIVSDYVAKNNNRKIKLIDIESEGKKINIHIVSGTATENSRTPAECTPFGTTDYWDWSNGKCGAYAGQSTNSSSAVQLMKKLNANCVSVICTNGSNIVYTNITTTEIKGIDRDGDNTAVLKNIPNPYDVTIAGDEITDFCLFSAYGSFMHTCLAPNEMNAYASSIKYLANLNKPANKEVVNYNLIPSFVNYGGQNNIFHILTFTSGTKTCYLETN